MNINDLVPLIEQLNKLHKATYTQYTSEVDRIIKNLVTDENRIELTLDYMLSYCSDEKMLLLYKKLCRYYWDINPQATANYVEYYREMWDNENNEHQKEQAV